MVIPVVVSLAFGFRVRFESWFLFSFFFPCKHYGFLGVDFGWGFGVILLPTSLFDAALAIMTSMVETHLYEFHPMDEEVLNDFIDDKIISHNEGILVMFST